MIASSNRRGLVGKKCPDRESLGFADAVFLRILSCTSKYLEALRGSSRYFEMHEYKLSFPTPREVVRQCTAGIQLPVAGGL